jgi:hypothetical protein
MVMPQEAEMDIKIAVSCDLKTIDCPLLSKIPLVEIALFGC